MSQPLPLQGITVVELGSLISGPFASSILAQFGAEVIKVEPPYGGDPLRYWRTMRDGTSLWWYSQNRNKKSITVDLRSTAGQDIVKRLVRRANIVIENFRPGTLEKWGLGWDQLKLENSSLIMVRISGFGQTGPYRDRPGFGAIAEAIGGLRYLCGDIDRPPVRTGISIGDSLASLYAVIGTLVALRHVSANAGEGQCVDVALYEAVLGVMESLIPEYSATGHVRQRSGPTLPGIAPSNTYLTADHAHVVIAANSDAIFRRLMQLVGRPDLALDPRFARNDGRAQDAATLDAAISQWTTANDLATVLLALEGAAVPATKIYTAADIAADEHIKQRGMLRFHELPDGGSVLMTGVVPKLGETPGEMRSVGPALGEHTNEVLASIGIDLDQANALRAEGAI